MSWCPVCKYEYKDGIKLCADCGAELVDVLEENASSENDALTENNDVEELEAEVTGEDNISPEQVLEEIKPDPHRIVRAEPFVKAADRAENYRSSAYALLGVGIVGIVFLVLAYTGVIKLTLAANINLLFYVVMGTMFLIFVIVGFKSFGTAKIIQAGSKDEEELTDNIYKYFSDNCSAGSIDEIAINDEIVLSDEEKFFPRSQVIRNIIIDKFGELDESYLTELTETVYTNIFDN